MNVQDLPAVLLHKIHNHAYDCERVGLTNQPCAADQVIVTASNYLNDPILQNQAQCCRNINQMQPFIDAHNMGMTNMKKRIAASIQPEEVTAEKINEYLSYHDDGRFELVNTLLSFVQPNDPPINVNASVWMQACNDPVVLYNLFFKTSCTDAIALDLLIHMNLHMESPSSPKQLWRTIDSPSIKNVSPHICSEKFVKDLKHAFLRPIDHHLVSDFRFITEVDESMPNEPGIIVKIGESFFEHCCVPSLSLVLQRTSIMPRTFEKCYRITNCCAQYVRINTSRSRLDIRYVQDMWGDIVEAINYDAINVFEYAKKQVIQKSTQTTLCLSFTYDDPLLHQFIKTQYTSISYTASYSDFKFVITLSVARHMKQFIINEIMSISQLIVLNFVDILHLVDMCARHEYFQLCNQILHRISDTNLLQMGKRDIVKECLVDLIFNKVNNMTQDYFETMYLENVLALIRIIMNKANINTGDETQRVVKSIKVGTHNLNEYTYINQNVLRDKIKNILKIDSISFS